MVERSISCIGLCTGAATLLVFASCAPTVRNYGSGGGGETSSSGSSSSSTGDAGSSSTSSATGSSSSGGCDTTTPTDCGACGHDCTALPNVTSSTCQAGACAFSCSPGFAHCTANPDDGCETNISQPSDCGGCGMACPANAPLCATSGTTYTCVSGCPATSPTLCGSTCSDTASDTMNCGGCGKACTAGANATPTCSGGMCGSMCNPGFTTCSGACVNAQTDNNNCGMCGHVCPAGQSCMGGACVCPSPQIACGTTCVQPNTDPMNCGGCGKVCPVNDQCVNATCQCVAPNVQCGALCINPATDLHNCGACGHDCKFGSCSGATCQPVFIPTGSNVNLLAVDGTNIYAADQSGGKLYSCTVATCGNGGTTMPMVHGGMQTPWTILPVGGKVYVSEASGNVVDGLTPTGTVSVTVTATNGAYGLAADMATLYFSTGNSATGTRRTPLGVNMPSTLFSPIPEILLYDPTANALIGVQTGPFVKFSLATGGLVNPWFTENYQVNGAAIAAGKLFFTVDDTTGTNGGVFSCSTSAATCLPTAIVSGSAWGQEWRITADATYVYWTSQGATNKGLYRCAVGGCGGMPTLVSTDYVAQALANDSTSIYWTDGGTGIYRLAKQP